MPSCVPLLNILKMVYARVGMLAVYPHISIVKIVKILKMTRAFGGAWAVYPRCNADKVEKWYKTQGECLLYTPLHVNRYDESIKNDTSLCLVDCGQCTHQSKW